MITPFDRVRDTYDHPRVDPLEDIFPEHECAATLYCTECDEWFCSRCTADACLNCGRQVIKIPY